MRLPLPACAEVFSSHGWHGEAETSGSERADASPRPGNLALLCRYKLKVVPVKPRVALLEWCEMRSV